MKISVRALPVHDIIIDLSKQLKVPLEDNSGELTINLPQNLGNGFIRGSSFDSGIGVIKYNCTFFKDLEIHFVLNKTHPLKFIFCSEGRIEHAFEKDENIHTINTYQNIIVSSSGYNGHILYFKANETTQISSLEIIRNRFNKREHHHYQKLEPRLKDLFLDLKAEEHFYYLGNYSMKAADIVDEMDAKEFSGFLRSLFLEGKAFEMLVIQIAQYQDDQREDKLPQILRRSDVEKVKNAVEYIHDNLNKNHSVNFLAKEVGTNVNKLQDGFKFLFNLTVNKYMQNTKLEAAKELLVSSEHNISEIVNMIGLNNRSYFSKIFKEKYGVSPKYFLSSRKDNEGDQ